MSDLNSTTLKWKMYEVVDSLSRDVVNALQTVAFKISKIYIVGPTLYFQQEEMETPEVFLGQTLRWYKIAGNRVLSAKDHLPFPSCTYFFSSYIFHSLVS